MLLLEHNEIERISTSAPPPSFYCTTYTTHHAIIAAFSDCYNALELAVEILHQSLRYGALQHLCLQCSCEHQCYVTSHCDALTSEEY